LRGDEIWFLIGTDECGDCIYGLGAVVAGEPNMFVAQSNPCVEVWRCYHFSPEQQEFAGDGVSQNWKRHLPTLTERNFNPRTHPIYLQRAMDAARDNYEEADGKPAKASTQVYVLAERIYGLIGPKIDSALLKMTRE